MKLKVGARGSPLSRKQVEEVMGEMGIEYEVEWIETRGDRDKTSSLGLMEKTDFFTREVDEKVLSGECDIGIHSAKDLPEPLPKGLKIFALTKGEVSTDSLVMRAGEKFEKLKRGAVIGSSSKRRDRVIKELRPDLKCIEVRGTIEERLEKLDRGEVDGLVVAEAALIRLGLTCRNRIDLPGYVAPLQGKLAVVGREGDETSLALFKKIDHRKEGRVLYTGLNPKHFGKDVTHVPLIEIVPRPFNRFDIECAFADIPDYTHIIFTSKSGVEVFFSCLKEKGYSVKDLEGKEIVAIGKITAKYIEQYGVKVAKIADSETQEGIIHLLALEDLGKSYVFLPQSSRARCSLVQSLVHRGVRHQRCDLYDTKIKIPAVKPKLENFDEIIFTSPSTVDAFQKVFGKLPKEIKLTAIGSVTRSKLNFIL
jgi:hydroxymethylbilane synthase